MSTHEKCPECEKQKENLLNELFPDKHPSECEEWTLSQLQSIKKSVANHKQSQESLANSTAGQTAQNKLTIGNSLLGSKMNDIVQPNTFNQGLSIGNSLLGKKMNEI
jgi:hypothetical protein